MIFFQLFFKLIILTRSFVQVYAEAATRSEADELANKVAKIVKTYGGP
jgi:hypothetical protein